MEKEKEELIRRGQMLEAKLKYLTNELEKLTAVLLELQKAKNSLAGVEKGNETLFSIGGDILVKGEIKEDKVLFPVGSGYYLEMEKEKALEKIEASLENINRIHKNLKEEVKKSEKELIEMLRAIQG